MRNLRVKEITKWTWDFTGKTETRSDLSTTWCSISGSNLSSRSGLPRHFGT